MERTSVGGSAAADTSSPVGPQVGAGTLLGTRRGDTLMLELNPLYADNNVSLRGVARSTGLRGDWSWTTITARALPADLPLYRIDRFRCRLTRACSRQAGRLDHCPRPPPRGPSYGNPIGGA